MNAITQYDPYVEMLDFRRLMDQFRRNLPDMDGQQSMFEMPMDVCESQDAYEIEAAIPGMKKEDVEITLDDNILTIRGETKEEREEKGKGKKYHMRELRAGAFVRSIMLPGTVDANKIEAHYDNGILKLRLPKTEESKPKHIQIQSGGETKAIEGRAKESSKAKQ